MSKLRIPNPCLRNSDNALALVTVTRPMW